MRNCQVAKIERHKFINFQLRFQNCSKEKHFKNKYILAPLDSPMTCKFTFKFVGVDKSLITRLKYARGFPSN